MTILDQIIEYKRMEEVPMRMARLPLEEMRRRAESAAPPLDFVAALRSTKKVALIAEVKRASPSKGVLRAEFDPLQLASVYTAGGASAISVLTDERFFQGCLEHLESIRQQHPEMPILRKDFTVHPYQVYEARAAGADAVLLIAAALIQAELSDLLNLAHSLKMEALIEVHGEGELEQAMRLSPALVGVNNRNLHDFSVSLDTCLALRSQVSSQVCFVAESGIHTCVDVARLAAAGVDAMLVGEALITALDTGAKIKELTRDCQS